MSYRLVLLALAASTLFGIALIGLALQHRQPPTAACPCDLSRLISSRTLDGWRTVPVLQELCRCGQQRNPLLIDVGTSSQASLVDALLWREQNSSYDVVGFEPLPATCKDVAPAFKTAGARFVCKAVSDAQTRMSLHIRGEQGSSLASGTGAANVISVPTTTLDAEVGDAPVWMLKIDAQGAEVGVLRGAHRMLRARRVAWVLVEADPLLLRGATTASGGRSSLQMLLELLHAHSFGCVNARGRHKHPTLGYDPAVNSSTCGYTCPCRYTNLLCARTDVATPPPRWKHHIEELLCTQPNCTPRAGPVNS